MDSLIKLLPDNIANQIAAGEVIQRPASVVKELVENAVDAGATDIQIEIKDAGRTLIQVIDNGKGMAPMDARMAFERHATSKIRKADDLFALTTMGFRGEALPSIAAVAHVSLQTRTIDSEQGIRVELEGSKVVGSTPVVCPVGANFSVKHLFFNVPARRKFLKSDDTEFRHIISEVHNVSAVRPDISFTLRHNGVVILKLDSTSPKQRIIDLFGKRLSDHLLTIDMETPLVHIRGFVTKTSASRKRGAQQYFFVNDRYMKHPYFHRMVMNAYGGLIPDGEAPEYFLFFSVDPASIDVNISPTKTEIKFETEADIASILYSAVREILMMGAAVPSLDFDDEKVEIPVATQRQNGIYFPEPPSISSELTMKSKMNNGRDPLKLPENDFKMPDISDWDKFYQDFESKRINGQPRPQTLPNLPMHQVEEVFKVPIPLLYGGYAVFSHPNGLALADLQRVRYKVFYERTKRRLQIGGLVSHRLLFPTLIELGTKEAQELRQHLETLDKLGFDISDMGQNAFTINAVPDGINAGGEELLLHQILSECQATTKSSEEILLEGLLRQLIRFQIQQGKVKFTPEEAQELLSELFTLPEHLITPEGKVTLSLLSDKEIDKRF
ncbi:MAG: DNA mismatch repair endonuclease MutL [Bacteroidales bacterium]|uniref:DNA mismatch repair endonuclease MutL n=1 Tax=Porphyromonas sp. TaxID=1924944 RepID=UPI00297783F3|nr:DNA mismatch repair endonuclease MutL [Porphyromonas sp.]MDD7438144.1 DNA mismatch repair endonuclease MutL [Bacteroidales bacterium]MDY3066791.1 DNA mismatch repair endonuclease MutL [Porphyromonas sp.]